MRRLIDVAEQGLGAPILEVHAPHGDGDHLGARRAVRVGHDLVRRILSRAYDQA